MAGPIKIDIITEADANDLTKVSDALEDVSDSLDDVGDSADDAGKEIERSLEQAARKFRDLEKEAKETGSNTEDYWRDAAEEIERNLEAFKKDGEKAFEALETEAEQAAKEIDRDLTKALELDTKGVADNAKRGFGETTETVKEFSDETRQNLAESVSSFRGDVEDIPQLLQDVLGGVSSNIGLMGGLAAAGVAAAIGITIEQLQNLADRINEAKEEAASLSREMLDAGGGLASLDLQGIIRDWSLEIKDSRQWWEVWQDEARTTLEVVSDSAKNAGVDLGDLFNAMQSGSAGAVQDYIDGLKEQRSELEWYSAAAGRVIITEKERHDSLGEIIYATQEYADSLRMAEEITVKQVAAEQGISEAHAEAAIAAADAADAEAELSEARQEAYDNTVKALDAELGYYEQVEKSTAVIAENGATLDKHTESGRANWSTLGDLRDAFISNAEAMAVNGASANEVYVATQNARAGFIGAAEAAGMSNAEAVALADAWGLIPNVVSTDVTNTANAARAESDRYGEALKNLPAGVDTKAKFEKSQAESDISVLDAVIRRTRTMTIGTAIDTSAVSNYKPPTKYMDVIARPGKATIT